MLNRFKSIVAALLLACSGWSTTAAGNEAGDVAWFDLITENEQVAGEFYAALFGWEVVSDPADGKMFIYKGTPIAGMSPIDDSVPDVDESQWIPVIIVEDVARAAEAATSSGGKIERPVTTASGWLTYTVIRDPEGVVVALVRTERPLGGNDGAGNWVWAEMWTNDVDAAATFYGNVVGYENAIAEREDGPYPYLKMNDDPKAGIVRIAYEGVDPGWAPYIGIVDMDATLRTARELGGFVYLWPEETSADGRIALLGDPLGTAFFVYELDEEEQ